MLGTSLSGWSLLKLKISSDTYSVRSNLHDGGSVRVNRKTVHRNELLGMLTEVAFTCALIGTAYVISWLFFLRR